VGWADKHDAMGIYRSFGWLLKITVDGCIDTLCMPTSIDDLHHSNNELVHAYPNPFKEYITIATMLPGHANSEVTILDPLGNRVISETCSLPVTLNMGSFSPGVYFFTVKDKCKFVGYGKVLKVD
jgi:hypothetical protein